MESIPARLFCDLSIYIFFCLCMIGDSQDGERSEQQQEDSQEIHIHTTTPLEKNKIGIFLTPEPYS